MTTAHLSAEEAIAYLTTRGFQSHRTGSGLWGSFAHLHSSGNAQVVVVDAEAACFDVHAYTRDRRRCVDWEVRLTRAPLPVFAATVAAAID